MSKKTEIKSIFFVISNISSTNCLTGKCYKMSENITCILKKNVGFNVLVVLSPERPPLVLI